MEKTIKIPEGYKFKEVKDGEVVIEKSHLPVTERIKTFEDAVYELGEDNDLVQEYRQFCANIKCFSKDLEAYLKLRIITEALNEGWGHGFEEGERGWTPNFFIYTSREMEKMSDKDKNNCRVLHPSNNCAYADGGVSIAIANSDYSVSYATLGSRLAFRTKKLAEYAGKQFIDIYYQMICIE